VIVRFVDIGGIVDQHYLNSLFIELVSDCCLTPTQQFFILSWRVFSLCCAKSDWVFKITTYNVYSYQNSLQCLQEECRLRKHLLCTNIHFGFQQNCWL